MLMPIPGASVKIAAVANPLLRAKKSRRVSNILRQAVHVIPPGLLLRDFMLIYHKSGHFCIEAVLGLTFVLIR